MRSSQAVPSVLLLLGLFISACTLFAQHTDTDADHQSLPWTSDLAQARQRAWAERKPILIRVGVGWNPVCRRLAETLKEKEVQAELAHWVLVYWDATGLPKEAEELSIGGLPAIRLRSAGWQDLASRDGPIAAEELVAWLKEHREAASASPDSALLNQGEPTVLEVVRLIRQFSQRDPLRREAAIQRLLPYPKVGAAAVVRGFRDGNLATRLAALELLHAWKAPVDGLDPWQPESITAQSINALERWSDDLKDVSTVQPEKLSEAQLVEARQQIQRLLDAGDTEAEAIRERLARLGEPLLAEVYEQLKQADSDRDRERLLTLRYRLVANPPLVLDWPGGLARLAASDAKLRRQAASQLAELASADDQRLLLELFSDPDPLIREIALRSLHRIGGKEVTTTLVELLADPEPNVRAAVLKQLAEEPTQDMLPKVAEYVKQESDPDLLVHAIRYLRAAKGPAAVKVLMSLLKHESWQVRAEAAEAIGGVSTSSFSFDVSPFSHIVSNQSDEENGVQVDAYVALLDLLEDPDAFVVSRAVQGLSEADMAVAVEPLVQAASKHPSLASNIVQMLAAGEKMRAKAVPHLREFCRHEDPTIRAAAIAGLCRAVPSNVDKELATALEDSHSQVRIAALTGLFGLLEASRRQAAERLNEGSSLGVDLFGFHTSIPPSLMSQAMGSFAQLFRKGSLQVPPIAVEEGPVSGKEGDQQAASPDSTAEESDQADSHAPEPYPWDQWLTEFYAGRGRPTWMTPLVPQIEKMLEAEAAEERMAAAQALVPLGKAEQALPILLALPKQHPELIERAAQVLPWLVWENRLSAFNRLLELSSDETARGQLVSALAEIQDRRTTDRFWQLLEDPQLTLPVVGTVYSGLLSAYYGQRYYDPSDAAPTIRREVAGDAKRWIKSGSEFQRVVALALLAGTAPDEVAEVAAGLVEDAQLSEPLRRDALTVLLITQPREQAVKTAIAALESEDQWRKELALTYLAVGGDSLTPLRDVLYLFGVTSESYTVGDSGEPIIPEPPWGLESRHVRAMMAEGDPKIAAYAGYLVALFGEPEGLQPLLQYWRNQKAEDKQLDRLVYRAESPC
jgi:HEAT repeat protein